MDDDRLGSPVRVAVLSYGYWTRRFGGSKAVLGEAISVNGTPLTVVGVAAPLFDGVQAGRRPDVYVPITMKAAMTPRWDALDDPKNYWVQLIGRLKPGVSPSEASASLTAVYRPLLGDVLPTINNWNGSSVARFSPPSSSASARAKSIWGQSRSASISRLRSAPTSASASNRF